MQAVHADDVADAYARVLRSQVRGAFNVAAGPVLDPTVAAQIFRGFEVPCRRWCCGGRPPWRQVAELADPGPRAFPAGPRR